jgi:hypothetical protein
MKDWQHGHDLEYLKSIEALYSDYNKYSDSPFAKYKKNDIASDLNAGDLYLEDEGSFVVRPVYKTSFITMYPGVNIGKKNVNDIVFTRIRGSKSFIQEKFSRRHIDSFCESYGGVWLYHWAEDFDARKIIEKTFDYVGSKITTFGEIYAVYYTHIGRNLFPIDHPKIDATEHVSIKKLMDVEGLSIGSITQKLLALNLDFQNHYSNYNKKKSWSAISLRGYSDDILRIEKPVEMSKKWQDEHADEDHSLRDTFLREKFPEVDSLLKPFGEVEIHRIRFMKLSPGGGELTRHTDQVDPDSGGSIGKLARLHFPLLTNDAVEFMVWEPSGNKKVVNMKPSEMWFLDTRKPHMVVNGGTTDRLHLVIDVKTNAKLRDVILQ